MEMNDQRVWSPGQGWEAGVGAGCFGSLEPKPESLEKKDLENNNNFTCFLFFAIIPYQFAGKKYFAKQPIVKRRSRSQKIPGAGAGAGAGAAWEKNQKPEPLEKKNQEAGAAKKLAGSPALAQGVKL